MADRRDPRHRWELQASPKLGRRTTAAIRRITPLQLCVCNTEDAGRPPSNNDRFDGPPVDVGDACRKDMAGTDPPMCEREPDEQDAKLQCAAPIGRTTRPSPRAPWLPPGFGVHAS